MKKFLIKRLLCLHCPLLLLFITFNAQSDEIKVVTEYLEPYQIKNADGSLGGFSTEVVQALFKQTNHTANIIVMPWARAYEVAKKEPNVMIFSIARTPSRNVLFQWIGKLTEERLYFWGLKTDFAEPIDDIDKLKDFKVGASRFSNAAQYLIDNKFYNIYQLIKEDQNMQMLYKKRIDLIVATEMTLQKRSKKLGLNFDNMRIIKEVTELNNDLSLAFNLNSDAKLVQQFQDAFQALKDQGILEKLKQKWQIEG